MNPTTATYRRHYEQGRYDYEHDQPYDPSAAVAAQSYGYRDGWEDAARADDRHRNVSH